MTSSSQAQSFCVDGDIKMAAGEDSAAAVSFLHAHVLNGDVTKQHVTSLAPKQVRELVAILQEWLKPKEEAKSDKSKLGVVATPDQIWEFIFCLEPEAVTTCFARIDTLIREKRYQQVIDSCTAILKQYPQETAPVLLQRGLARTLIKGQDKEAISDYLRAYLKDKDATVQVVRHKQIDDLKSVMTLMRNCVYSTPPSNTDAKAHKQWIALTIDCCRFLLTFEPDDFALQMTFAERLKSMHKTERAITMLNETLDVLHLDEKPDTTKLTEVYLRRGACYMAKQHVDQAISDITNGLNAENDAIIRANARTNSDNDLQFLTNDNKTTVAIAKDIFGGKTSDLADLYVLLDKSANKLSAEDRFKTVTKIDNIRACSDLYRALLVVQPTSKDAMFKLANCYAKLGKNKQAIQMYDKMVEDHHFSKDSSVLSARAACHRELGDKVKAQKDYDALLRNNPKDVVLLCERAMVYMEDHNLKALVDDLLQATRINQKQTIIQLNKELLVQRTRTRQVLFDYAKSLLQDAPLPLRRGPRPDAGSVDDVISENDGSASSIALSLAQLLTRLNPADQSAHILMAQAMFHSGCTNDAETKLKKMLQDNFQTVDVHVVKLHLGLMKIFTKRIDDGMASLIEVLLKKGERVVSSLLRDIPVSERAHLADESHQFGIDVLQKNRDKDTVKQAISCFTIAILSCRGTDLVLEETSALWLLLPSTKCLSGIRKKADKMSNSAWSLASYPSTGYINREPRNTIKFRFAPQQLIHLDKRKVKSLNGGTGVYRSYLARAECMAHLGDQRAAILDFSAAIEVNSSCVEGLCGRAFMRLALGDENDCVHDVTLASGIDLYTVVAHIHALPAEAKKLLLFWIDHRVVVLLLNYGYKATSGERLSTGGSASTISMIDETAWKPGHNEARRNSSLSSIHPPSTISIREETQEELLREATQANDGDKEPNTRLEEEEVNQEGEDEEEQKHLQSSQSTRDLKEALLSLDAAYDSQIKQQRLVQNSRGSTTTTVTSLSNYDDVISGMEKAEILHRAIVLGRLLISVDDTNVSWHGMYADILIVKGDFDEALRHLHIVMELNANDVTAVARAGLINAKMNRYPVACALLRSLCPVDRSGLVYVLKALDSGRRKRLSEESLNYAEEFSRQGKFVEARDSYSLSILSYPAFKVDKLRARSRCNVKIGDTGRAINDISEVIKENLKKPIVSDYCTRAGIYLIEGKEFQACRDYIKAIETEKNQAITLIHVKPGRSSLCKIFFRQAMEAFNKHNFQECHDLCDVALLVDDGDIGMRKLRARAKREISKCVIQ